MVLRLRPSRTLSFALIAILTLLLLAYFPFSKIRAANTATILPSAGKPLVNLKSTLTPAITYTGSAGAVAALKGGTATPTALASADFNHDGAMDIVAGYSTKGGGALVIFHGNPDAFAPTDQTLYGKAIIQGKVPPTFLPKATVFSLPESPDLLVTADFNGDGHKDVLVAARGSSNLYLLPGDGSGNLLAAQTIPLLGQVRAFDATADGHVAVSIDGSAGSELAILDPGSQGLASQGLTARATYPLPAQGNSVAWGGLGGGLDVAVGAGSNVVLVYGALTAKPQTETVTLPYQVQGLALGNFIWNRDGRTAIAVQADDGSIHILQHGTLNTTPLTVAEIPGRRHAIMAQRRQQKGIAPNPTALGPWSEAKQLPYSGPAPSGPLAASAFNSPRVTSSSTHDVMVVDAQRGQLHILDTSGKTSSPSADVSFSGTPVAALALPNKINSDRDIVVLTSSQATPLLVTSGGSLTLTVNTTADIDTVNACTSDVTTPPSTLSLREAVCIANNNAETTTINIPSGTYDLTSLETGELQQGTGNPYSLTINGTGTASNTLIQQTDGHDRILEEDYAFTGNNPITIENVTLQLATCTTGTDCEDGGGAVLAGGQPGDDFTVTNVVVNDNSVTTAESVDYGGGLNSAGSNFTITNCTISNNTANDGGTGGSAGGDGGGVYYTDYPPTVEGVVTVTNSSFTNNTSSLQGGGISAELDTGYPMTVTGSTFTGNAVVTSGRDGGGIAVDQDGETATTFTLSNSRIVGNTEASGSLQPATGVAVDETTANLENNWWGCNAGPGGSGCDTVYIEDSGSYTPVLTLSISAGSTSVLTNGTTTLTAKLNNSGTCSGYIGNACYVPDGTSATFSGGTLGSASPSSTTFSGGVATSTFTAGATPGTTTASVTVDNQTEDVTINIGTPPLFTSGASTTFTAGTHGSFTVTASGTPSPTITQTGGSLPNGVTFNSGTGSATLTGTPAEGTGGVYTLTFQAANGNLPNATQTFTLTVDQAPSITSVNSTTFTYNTFGTFTVTSAAGTYPTATFSESGSLPNGVTLSTAGVLSGTPTQTGTFPITITAANGVSPNATQNFTLTVGALATSINVTSVSPSSEAYGLDSTVTITAVLSWTGSGTPPTASDVGIGGNGPSGYSGTSCGSPVSDTLTCTATYTPSASDTVGSYTESASFSGDGNYTGSSSPQTNNFSITQATTSTSVISSQNPSTVGESVTFTATINGEYGEVKGRNGAVVSRGVSVSKRGAPQRILTEKGKSHPLDIGGTVTWSSNTGCSPSTVSGDPGTAQCTTTSLPQGTDTITATYGGDTNHTGSTGTLAGGQVVNPVITATSINVTGVSPSSEVYGLDSAVTITAVLSWTGSGPEPTPSDVSIGGTGPSGYSATSCGSPSGDTLTCTATYTPTASDTVGTYTESATFSGDSNYSGSSSPQTNNFSITQATSSTSVISSQNPSTVGESVTFTATINGEYGEVKGRNGVVLGRVNVVKKGVPQRGLTQKGKSNPLDIGGTVTWSSNTGCSPSTVSGDPGTAQCTTTTLPQGTDTITATYGGDTNHSGSTGTLSGGQVVNPVITATSINVTSVSPSTEVYGLDSAVTITAVLSWTGSGPAPTASDVSIGGTGPSGYSATSCGSPSGDTLTCTATYTPTASDTVGTYTESATFSGDSNYSGSSSPQTNNFSITQATTSTSVISSQNPSTVGESVTFTATISGEYGEVKGRNGVVLGRVSVVKKGVPQRGLTQKGKSNPQDIGGTVTWSSNTGCSPSTVSGDPGTAQCTTTSLPQGTDTITATYGGDTNHSGSTGTLSGGQVVNPVITATSINVTRVSPSTEVYGLDSTVTITAVLSWTGSGPAPTASDVTIGGTGPSGYSATTCGSPVSDTLTCTATYTPTASDTVGTYTESATFSGDSNYSGSSSPQTNNFSITQATSSTSVISSQNPSTVGQSVTFTATIDGEYGLIVKRNGAVFGGVTRKGMAQKGQAHPSPAGITGTVTWSSNTGCSPSTVAGDPGTAQCTTTTLPQGTDTITATYGGDTNHSGSTGTLSGGQVVNGQAEITLTPTSINFGTDYLHELKDQNVTVKNTGTTSVTINSVTVTLGSGTNKGDFTALNLCPKTLAAGKSCLINVVFVAGNIGNLSATVDVNDNATGSPQTVSLSATVINPIASYNPFSLNFGTVKVGHSVTKNVTLTNKGTTALDITSISVTGADKGDYQRSDACPSSLNPGADCVISVTFTPSKTGTRTANLTVVDNAAIGTQNVPLTGKGSNN